MAESITTLSTTLSAAAYNMACGVVGTKCYLFDSGSLITTNVFDTETNTITTLSTTLPTAATGIACGVVGTKCYLFGGFDKGDILNTINVFDTETNTITTLSITLPTATYGIACGVVGTKCYLFGGYNTDSGSLNTINVFDTETNSITTLSITLPTAASYSACGVVGTKCYLFGGFDSGDILNTINVFDSGIVLIVDVPRIIYNNTVIAELSDKEITITCAGKKMLSDIVIVNRAVEEEASLISFTIDGTSYQAEEGMTWADWCDSDYSGGTYAPHPNLVTQPCKYPNSYFITEDGTSGGSVLMTDTIIANHAYSTIYIDTSGGA